MTVTMFAAAGLKPPGHGTLDPRLYAAKRSLANPTRRVPRQTQSSAMQIAPQSPRHPPPLARRCCSAPSTANSWYPQLGHVQPRFRRRSNPNRSSSGMAAWASAESSHRWVVSTVRQRVHRRTQSAIITGPYPTGSRVSALSPAITCPANATEIGGVTDHRAVEGERGQPC
jgi:hypothetical protein